MSWDEVIDHDKVIERFRQSVSRNRLASTYLFVGRPGIGKRTFAIKLAQALLCETNPESQLEPCDSCQACTQVRAGTHPDLIQIAKPKDKSFIPVDLFIGDREHRRQRGLCHEIGLKPFRGGRKIAIIDDADFLNAEGANCLLKTLEEPPPKSVLILIGSSVKRQLSTIVSRSQVVLFQPLSRNSLAGLIENQIPDCEVNAMELAGFAGGSIERAKFLADPEIFEFRSSLFEQLSTGDPGRGAFAKAISSFVDGAGKDSSAKRARLTLVGDLAIEFYKECMNWLVEKSHGEIDSGIQISAPAMKFIQPWLDTPQLGFRIAADAIEQTIEMQKQVSMNANSANVIGAWLSRMGKAARMESAS